MADMTQGAAPADQSGATDPSQATPAPDDMSNGFCIELTVKPDGSMTVSVEPASEEQSEEGESEEQAQSVPNLQSAFKLIREIIDHAGQMADAGQGQDEMSAGYGKAG